MKKAKLLRKIACVLGLVLANVSSLSAVEASIFSILADSITMRISWDFEDNYGDSVILQGFDGETWINLGKAKNLSAISRANDVNTMLFTVVKPPHISGPFRVTKAPIDNRSRKSH